MTGTKLYAKKSRVYFFLLTYGILAVIGIVLIAQSFLSNENPSGAAGFLVIFGAGMFVQNLLRGRRPQISVYEDFLELNQSRAIQLVRYRNLVTVSRPDNKRLVVACWEDGRKKEMNIWLKELEKADVEMLYEFLSTKSRKGK